jgi:hypothetical protein
MDNWTIEETELLTKLYVQDKLALLEICAIMKKKCKVITSKLIELDIVKYKNQVRGTKINTISSDNQVTTNVSKLSELSEPNKFTSIIQLLVGINQVINEVSKICESYTKVTKEINKTLPTNPSK